jgi:hypothetical protein
LLLEETVAAAGDNGEGLLSDGAESDDGAWLREEDAIHIPSDADLEAMSVSQALTTLLNAQRSIIFGLGRVDEPWDVRLQYAASVDCLEFLVYIPFGFVGARTKEEITNSSIF